ncbi:MAG: hypothetical protein M3024_05955 [Candidatus Dormibacteraeota bacterium]|nr:hypothetical protein [Candidatus Dormibacteraeota bacterium]
MEPTPLQPRRFFSGTWRGDGELRYRGPLRLLRRPDRFTYLSSVRGTSAARWEFEDHFHYRSGLKFEQRFACEVVDERRLHVTSDDMPGGADILLSERGYTFTPYVMRVRSGPFTVQLRCRDVNGVDGSGMIHDRIDMMWLGLPVATMTMDIHVDRTADG